MRTKMQSRSERRASDSSAGVPTRLALSLVALAWMAAPLSARASFLEGEALDTMADVIAWVALVIAPVAGLTLFWMVHILPEKIAHKRHHPQVEAIHTLCILSLFFAGMLWPFAFLWAFSKPVFYKMAYGTDKLVPGQAPHIEGGGEAAAPRPHAVATEPAGSAAADAAVRPAP
jgi:hypothetical protein